MGIIFKGDSLVDMATAKDQTAGARDFYLQGIQTASGLVQDSTGYRMPCAGGIADHSHPSNAVVENGVDIPPSAIHIHSVMLNVRSSMSHSPLCPTSHYRHSFTSYCTYNISLTNVIVM
jgi:hypothetical protein